MQEEEKNKINLTRTQRREQERATELIDILFKQFIDFKNKNFTEKDGYILFPSSVYEKFDACNWGWRAFCNRENRSLNFNLYAFKNKVDDHILSHRKLAWTNYIMTLCKNTFGIDVPDVEALVAGYNETFEPIKAVIQIVFSQITTTMHTYEIPELFIKETFASNLDELTQEEYIYFVEHLLLLEAGYIDEDIFKYKLLLKIAKIKLSRKYRESLKSEDQSSLVIIDNLMSLASKLDSFFIENNSIAGEVTKTINLESVKCHISKIANLYGPADMLQNCSFYEYRVAHEHFIDYITNNSEKALNTLVAVLYRPKKYFHFIKKHLKSYDGDIRENITAKTNLLFLEKRADEVKKLPFSVRYGIFLFFAQIERQLRHGKLIIEGKEIDMNILYEGGEVSEDETPGIGLTGLLFTLAETKVFGNVEETDNHNLWDVMVRLYQVTLDNKKQLEKVKANGSNTGV